MPSSTRTFLRLRISLVESEPEIWRTFDIDASLTLADLHDAIQIIMGWRDSHLHEFTDRDPWEARNRVARIGRPERRWGMTDVDAPEGLVPDSTVTIAEAFDQDGPLFYEYDFGDGWTHQIELIERGPMDAAEPAVTVVRGERRAPFEDSGGVHGYAEIVKAIGDPTHPEHKRFTEWVTGTIGPWRSSDPEHFDAAAVQRALDRRFGAGDSRILPASALGTLLDRLPSLAAAELVGHLDAAGMLEVPRPTVEQMAEVIAPFQWLIDAVGADGLALTQAGWMPPAVVLDGMTTLGWRERWIGEANREDITVPMRLFRETATRMGIVRKVKGRLLLGADAKKCIGDVGKTWDLATSRVLRGLTDSEVDPGTLLLVGIAEGTITADGDAWEAIAFGLETRGWVARDPRGFTPTVIGDLTARLVDVLEPLRVLSDGSRYRPREAAPAARAFARDALLR